MASELDRLINQADKAVHNMGGLLLILLAVKRGRLAKVRWNQTLLQFEIDGQIVSLATLKTQLATLNSKLAIQINKYNSDLAAGLITLEQWKAKMAALVENSHMLFGALALGGLVPAAASAVVQRKITRDLNALTGWAVSIKNKQVPGLAMMANRGRAYLQSAYVTYEIIDHKLHIDEGFVQAKRILTPAEHCRTRPDGTEGCFEVAAKGWLDIREMPPIGTLVCGQFCKCYIIYQ